MLRQVQIPEGYRMIVFHVLLGIGVGLTIYGIGFYRGFEQGKEISRD